MTDRKILYVFLRHSETITDCIGEKNTAVSLILDICVHDFHVVKKDKWESPFSQNSFCTNSLVSQLLYVKS